jgi:uncharacterized protein YggT (Ycf19 family)
MVEAASGPTIASGVRGGRMDQESKSWVLTIGKVITGIVYAITVVYLVILTLAFFLRLFGANPAANFANWVYTAAARIMEPFRGIFPDTPIGDRAVFDASLLFAIIVYSILALALHALIGWFTSRLSALRHRAELDRYYGQFGTTAATQQTAPDDSARPATAGQQEPFAVQPAPTRPYAPPSAGPSRPAP